MLLLDTLDLEIMLNSLLLLGYPDPIVFAQKQTEDLNFVLVRFQGPCRFRWLWMTLKGRTRDPF